MKNNENLSIKKILFHRFIFILIFAIIAIGITSFFIIKNKPVEIEEEETIGGLVDPQEQVQVTEDEKTIDANGTYNENAIEAKTYTMDIQGRPIEYLQIDGLKDESIEIKINQEMKSTIQNDVQKFIDKGPSSEVYTYTMMTANFANVLSIYSHVSASFGENNWEYAENYFNFDLTTGNKIELTDIFSSKISIKNVLTDNLYEAIVSNYATYDDESGNLYLDESSEDVEEIVYGMVSDYLRGKDIGFYITPQMLVIRKENIYAKILYTDYLEYITIYDKFSEKTDIYDGNYTAQKDVPNLIDLRYFGETYLIEEETDNYYIRLGVLNYLSDVDKVEETVKNYVDELAEEYRKEAKESGIFKVYDGTFYIFENYGNYENFQVENYEAYANIYELDTTKSNFENVLKPKMLEHYKQDFSEAPEVITKEFLPYVTSDCEVAEERIVLDNLGNILEENENSNTIEIYD